MSAQAVANLLCAAWFVTWFAAGAWSGRTKVQLRTDAFGPNRFLTAIGVVMLFWRARGGGGALAHRLWGEAAVLDWSLAALVALGFAFCWWARLHLGRLWSAYVTLKEGHRVVDTGPYALVRHPIYSGLMLSALGLALLRATPLAFLGWALFSLGFAMTARIEERFLRQQLGEEAYGAYSRRVGMLVPKIGP